MSKLKALGTPAIIVLILIGSALLTAVFPIARDALTTAMTGETRPTVAVEPSGPETVTLDVDGYLLGDELIKIPALQEVNGTETNSLVVLGALAAVVIGGLVALTLPIAAFVVLGDRMAGRVKEDPQFQAGVAALEQKEQAFVKERMATQPAKPRPSGYMPRWAAISTGLLIILLAYFTGLIIGAGFGGDGRGFANVFALIALLLVAWRLRPGRVEALDVERSDAPRIPWGAIWVVLTGAIMIGLGIGAMVAVINGKDPFVIFTADWWWENVLTPLLT